jgi:fucose permease
MERERRLRVARRPLLLEAEVVPERDWRTIDLAPGKGTIVVAAAGTSDLPVAEEAAVTAELMANTVALVVAGASVAGFGLASVFPINIALLSQWFGEMSSHVGGMMFALSSLGGATVPWLVGALSSRFGSLRAGLTVPLAGSITMLFLYLKNRNPDRLT